MLAHAASAQGISAVENMCGREHVLDHSTVPAACFTHPEVNNLPVVGLCLGCYVVPTSGSTAMPMCWLVNA